MDALVNELVAELSIPLGTKVVPESTRRGRMARNADDLADMLLGLAQKFGIDDVMDILGQPLEDGQPVIQHLIAEYGEDTLKRAFDVLQLKLRAQQGTPPEEQYLPAT